jgi:hypothetical protein
MELWLEWWICVRQLRPAFSRTRTFMWFAAALAAMCVRTDRLGVTSLVRAIGLKDYCYDRLLDCFHSPAINLDLLSRIWSRVVLLALKPFLYTVGGRLVILADGIKIAKAGRKMPAVKRLRNSSGDNNKPKFIYGHSCQALALVVRAAGSFMAIPLACRIHEGIVVAKWDRRSILDKLILLVNSLAISLPFYVVADTYYAAAKIIRPLLKTGQHIITAVRLNAVAYESARPPLTKRYGRRRIYAGRVKLRRVFKKYRTFTTAMSPIYGEKNVVLRYRVMDMCWRSAGGPVRFVLVIHPTRGKKILLSTDMSLSALQIIETFGIRFKIEVAFKQAIHTVGTYAYHFWLGNMNRHHSRRYANLILGDKPEPYRRKVQRKIHAYHVFIQLGTIAQGILQILAISCTGAVRKHFGSWIRTVRPGILPSEFVVILALRHSLPLFLADCSKDHTLTKFIRDRIDLSRAEGLLLAA